MSGQTVVNLAETGPGSLRQAIADAPWGATITFAPGLNGGTVTLANGYTLTKDVTIDASALPDGIILDGAGVTRALVMGPGLTGSLVNLSMVRGKAVAREFPSFARFEEGGAVYCEGNMTITNCRFANNFASWFGGAISSHGTLRLVRCIFSGNSATLRGGAFYGGAHATMEECVFSNNTAGSGGAIHNISFVTLLRCVLEGNSTIGSSGPGGAIWNSALLFVRQSTVTRNSAAGGGGGIYGGGELFHCTVTDNVAGGNGGAVYGSNHVMLTHCTVTGNSALGGGGVFVEGSRVLSLSNSIMAGNLLLPGSPGAGADVFHAGITAPYGVNIVPQFTNVGSVDGPGTVIAATPLLAPLGEYGGVTPTRALMPGSPARNGGTALNPPVSSDQRGVPVIGLPDIGAYESGDSSNYSAWIWESLPPAASAAAHGGTVDFDHDGSSNHDEWLGLSDPNSGGSFFAPVLSRDGASRLIRFPTASGRTYRLRQSQTLEAGSWIDAPGQPLLDGDGSVRGFTVPAIAGRWFFLVVPGLP